MMAGSQTPEDTGDAGQELRENASLTATPEAVGSADISDDIEILDEDVERQMLLKPAAESNDPTKCGRAIKQKVKSNREKIKRKIANTRAPMTILWGRDGWEKFVAFVIFVFGLIFQLIGILGQGWIKHCYSIAFVPDRFSRCPSYHLWQVCHAKGSRGCSGYYVAIFLFCCAILCTFAMVHFLWAYLQGHQRTFKIGSLSSNTVVMLPGTLTLAGCFSFWLQMPPYLGQLWWNFYLQVTVSLVLCGAVICTQPRGMD